MHMKKRTKGTRQAPHSLSPLLPRLILLMSLFLVGAIVGSFFAANLSPQSQQLLEQSLQSSGSLFGAAWQNGSLLLDMVLLIVVFCSAYWKVGVVMVPLSLMSKGFLLSMLVTAYVKTMGIAGYLSAIVSTVLGGFLSVAALVVLALQAFGLAGARATRKKGQGKGVYIDRSYYFSACVCMVMTVLSALLQTYVAPLLQQAVFLLF